MLKQGLSLSVSLSEPGYDFWGEQIANAIAFFDSGFKRNLLLADTVADEEECVASEMFDRQGGTRWFLRSSSVPGIVGLKALAVDEKGLYLETALLDPEKVNELIQEMMLPLRYQASRNRIVDTTTNKVLVRLVKAKPDQLDVDDDYIMDDRCLWTIELPKLDAHRRKVLVQLADEIARFELFIPPEDVPLENAPLQSRPKLELKLNLALQQRLALEQRPLLSVRGQIKLQTTTKLGVMLGMQQRVLNMTGDQLMEFTMEYAAERGQHETVRFLDFVIAGGKIKETQPKLTWKEARRIGRLITAKQRVS